MATAKQPFTIPGVILFSHGELSYEVELSRGLVEDLAQSRLGERTVLAWGRMGTKRLRPVVTERRAPWFGLAGASVRPGGRPTALTGGECSTLLG